MTAAAPKRRGRMVENVALPGDALEETLTPDDEDEDQLEEDGVVEESVDDLDDDDEEWDSRKMPPEAEVWPDGPTFKMINEWKDEFGDIYVTSVSPEHHFVWRTITRFEYRNMVRRLEQALSSGQVSQAQANMDNEEAIAETCILFPKYQRHNPASEMGGVASTVAQQVMEASGFSSIEVRQL